MDDADEDTDEESSSIIDLQNFRQVWIKEIASNRPAPIAPNEVNQDSVSELAQSLYQFAVSEERNGNPYNAVNYYAKAFRLCPDVERKWFARYVDQQSSVESSIASTPHVVSDDDDASNEERKYISGKALACQNTSWHCEPEDESKLGEGAHISQLPFEVMLKIFGYVMLPDLDMRSLEMCSLVCKGFYCVARDFELWKAACEVIWGPSDSIRYSNGVTNPWREMFIKRPRLNYNGIYISRITYMRQGERNFQTEYEICQVMEYYRYLRFFSDGTVLFYTSPDPPKYVVAKFKSPNSRLSGLKRGRCMLTGDTVDLVLEEEIEHLNITKANTRRQSARWFERFELSLKISNAKKRPSCKLLWKSYILVGKHNGEITTFDVESDKFKPFIFARVKGFSIDSI